MYCGKGSCVLSCQADGTVVLQPDGTVVKYGSRVSRSEASSMTLVAKETKVPVPEILNQGFERFGKNEWGYVSMSQLSGMSLEDAWPILFDHAKESICLQLWCMIMAIRQIAKPAELARHFVC